MHVSSPSGSGQWPGASGDINQRIALIAGGMGQATIIELCD